MKIGQRIRYLSPNGSKSRNDKWADGVWLEHGILGSITEYHPELPEVNIGGKVFERIPAYAVVTFDNGASICIDNEDKTRWEYVK